MGKLKAAVLGATGMLGQRFIELLENHPFFEITVLTASERSAGKKYREAAKWCLDGEMPEYVKDMEVLDTDFKSLKKADFVFSALPGELAFGTEEKIAREGYVVISKASAHRMEEDVPLIIPEVNAEHLALIDEQRKKRKWKGAIITDPNCTTTVLALSLKPISDKFGLDEVAMVSMQALSGAGYPGVPSLDMIDNVVPFIKGEEEKVVSEMKKLFSRPHSRPDLKVTASCNRVPTLDGHLEAVFVKTSKRAELEDVREAFKNFSCGLRLPSSPERPIIFTEKEDRPQPRLDRNAGKGMSVTVGRLRKDDIFSFRYMVLGHNTVRGGAGGAILNAELLKSRGYL